MNYEFFWNFKFLTEVVFVYLSSFFDYLVELVESKNATSANSQHIGWYVNQKSKQSQVRSLIFIFRPYINIGKENYALQRIFFQCAKLDGQEIECQTAVQSSEYRSRYLDTVSQIYKKLRYIRIFDDINKILTLYANVQNIDRQSSFRG